MAFVPGIELSRRFYREILAPLLGDLPHSAALLGAGSEVLGFDTVRSTDHDWGPRLQLFLRPADIGDVAHLVDAELPGTFLGHRTRFTRTDADAERHGVEVTTLDDWLRRHLGFDPRTGVELLDWLGTPTQLLAEVTAGAVHHDGLGGLGTARAALAWYPDDLWRHVLACQWQRIAQEEPFVGRCGEVGDELGSAVVAARLVRDLMRLCLLLERRYPPYAKWLGSAFAQVAGGLGPVLRSAVGAMGWAERERHLMAAYEEIARRQNALGLCAAVDPRVRGFHDRPFQVLDAARLTGALRDAITDPAIRALPRSGAVDQFVDSTDVLSSHDRSRRAAALAIPEIDGPTSAPAPGPPGPSSRPAGRPQW